MALTGRLPKLEKLDVYEVMASASRARAGDLIMLAKLLVSAVGKEKAIELIKKARQDRYYKAGVERAKALGNPNDLDTYLQDTFIECSAMPPWVQQGEVLQKTDRMVVVRTPNCGIARAIKDNPGADPETIDVIHRGYCQHDETFASGFNPKLKLVNTRNAVADPEDNCEFRIELED